MCHQKIKCGIGFKGLKAFNLALLAKQGWRIMQESFTLLHQIFKAHNFPNNYFLDLRVEPNPFHAWRGIMVAKLWICKGSRWRISSGSRVSIWKDRWILGRSPLNMYQKYESRDSNIEMVVYLICNSQRW